MKGCSFRGIAIWILTSIFVIGKNKCMQSHLYLGLKVPSCIFLTQKGHTETNVSAFGYKSLKQVIFIFHIVCLLYDRLEE